MLGSKIRRVEDPALLRGKGRFVDDIHLPGMLHARFLRSPHAHARIRSIDCTAARARAGVAAVFTLEDLRAHVTGVLLPLGMPSGALRQSLDPPVLADGEVRYTGEPVAVIVAESAYVAEDAAELVAVSYEPLPAVIDCRQALAAETPKAHEGSPGNLVAEFTLEYGDADAAFRSARHRFREQMTQHKGLGQALECRGVVARHDPVDDVLTVWAGTQMAHRARAILVELLGREESLIRVVAPHVGGGFGPKFVFYPEDAVVPLAALLLGRPVKWIEDRREHFVTATQERDQHWDMEVAADADGRLLAVRGTMIHDHGAYTPYGVNLPYNSATNFLGPYVLPHYRLAVSLAITNKVPVTPVRGAGRPQGTFAMERLLDRIARELGLDRAEVRRRNLIQPGEMPYVTRVATRDGAAMTYDSGDYPAALDRALARAGYDGFEARRAAARAEGRYIGIGIANYVEGTGRGPFESARIEIAPSGRITVATGATDQGQGITTALAQVCAASLGVDPGDVRVVAGDSAAVTLGLGAFASRQAVTAGSSVHVAAVELREKILKVASHLLEAAESDIELAGGTARVRGVPEMSVKLGDISRALAGVPGLALPGGMPPGLEATAHFSPDAITYCNGAHVAQVAVDPETGGVDILSYVVIHDSGRMINPMIVDGQVTGGAAHGIGTALFEHMIFDAGGQPQTATLADYLLPTAPHVPAFDIEHMESPAPGNPLGVKGAGEGGTIPAPAAIVSAIEDALKPFGVTLTDVPVTPVRIAALVRAGNKGNG